MEQKTTQVYHVSPEDLTQVILKGIEGKINALELRLQQNKSSEYIDRKEAANLLKVSLVTIHEWCKKEILKPYRIGNRVRFKREEIEETLESSFRIRK